MPNKLDRNASSPNRIRRNWQRFVKDGGLSGALTPGDTSLKLIGANLAVNVEPNGGLQTLSSGLGVKLAPNGGLENTTNGILEYGFRSATSTPLINDGDTYYDTTYTAPFFQEVGIAMAIGGKVYQAGGNSNTVSNTSSGTFTLPNGNFTFPPNFFTLG